MSKKEKAALLRALERMQDKDRSFVLRLAQSFSRIPSSQDAIPMPRVLVEGMA